MRLNSKCVNGWCQCGGQSNEDTNYSSYTETSLQGTSSLLTERSAKSQTSVSPETSTSMKLTGREPTENVSVQ